MAEKRVRLTDRDRARIVEGLRALIPDEVWDGEAVYGYAANQNMTDQWQPYIALAHRIKDGRRGGNEYLQLHARELDRRADLAESHSDERT